jgi:hypothetical protein
MLKVLGPRLYHLSVACTIRPLLWRHQRIPGNHLDSVLRHCQLLAHLSVDDVQPGTTAEVRHISTCQAATRSDGAELAMASCLC